MISEERIKQLASEAFPGYQRQDTENRKRVEKSIRAALTEAHVAAFAPVPMTCPSGCDPSFGTEFLLGVQGIERLRCLRCDTRWKPKPSPKAP